VADWSTIASLATAGGTLVLAVATFSSVRSSQATARIAERSLLVGLRPALVPSRRTDPPEKVRFGDGVYVKVEGGRAALEHRGDVFYLVLPLRNLGSGTAVLQAWWVGRSQDFDPARSTEMLLSPLSEFRPQSIDLYIAGGDTGFWQGAIRRPDDPFRPVADEAAGERGRVYVDLLYGDEEHLQRTVTRFMISRSDQHAADVDGDVWLANVIRHWRIDDHTA